MRCVAIISCLISGSSLFAQSDMDNDHKYAWTENCGWANWRDADGTNAGVIVDESFLSGHIWAENIGWINVGDGSPADGEHYANSDGSDFGVNIDIATGDLFGLAWGENIGWINFETSSLGEERARFDDCQGRFFGFTWAENIGWLNLNDAEHFVATVPPVCPADLNGDADVGPFDLAQLLGSWGPCEDCPADLDCDGEVGPFDLATLLGAWGPCS